MAIFDQRNTFLDFILGRGGKQGYDADTGFNFVTVSNNNTAGEQVNVENLLEEPTVSSCVSVITNGITQLPMCVKRMNPDGTFVILDNHPIKSLLKRPNAYQTPTEFKSSIITSLLTHGNCFIRIIRAGNPDDGSNTSGRPIQLVPMDPIDITIGANSFGIPVYHHETFGTVVAENIIHIRDITTVNPQGHSRLLLAAEVIGAKKAADRLMGETFKSGVNLSYAIETQAPLTEDQKKIYSAQLEKLHGSGGLNRGGIILLDSGTIKPVKGLTPADADLRELRARLINEIAGTLQVPSFMVGGTGNDKYNNVRQRLTSFHRDTLQPIIANIEEAMSYKLLDNDNESIWFDISDYIKGDIDSQGAYARENVRAGIWTQNEARLYLGMNPMDDPQADLLIPPNSTSTETTSVVEDEPTGGEDGPQSNENRPDRDPDNGGDNDG